MAEWNYKKQKVDQKRAEALQRGAMKGPAWFENAYKSLKDQEQERQGALQPQKKKDDDKAQDQDY